MPKIEKIFYLELTPKRFLESCSREELIEIDLLLSSAQFQSRMRCNDTGCPYHACMDDSCRRKEVAQNGGNFGQGNCKKIIENL